MDWSTSGQVDIDTVADAPDNWTSTDGPRRIYLPLHVNCSEYQGKQSDEQ
ncbi:hypothetical protein SIM91_44490 [Rhodococcus opacus]|nr:hypothetical protein [Rhodococcus opacus]MDX5970201.1 hypothetical protein [Rhodococcus opacus]